MSRKTRRTTGAVSRRAAAAACRLANAEPTVHAVLLCARRVSSEMRQHCLCAASEQAVTAPAASPHHHPTMHRPACRRLPPRAGWGEVQGWALHRAAQAGVGPLLHRVDGPRRAGASPQLVRRWLHRH